MMMQYMMMYCTAAQLRASRGRAQGQLPGRAWCRAGLS